MSEPDLLERLKAMYADALYGLEAGEVEGGSHPMTNPEVNKQRDILDKTFDELKAQQEELSRLRAFAMHFERHGVSFSGPEETRAWAREVLTGEPRR